jgi:hypothetical protein
LHVVCTGGGYQRDRPDHATGVIRPSETTFAPALAISLAAYPTGKIQSSDKSEHSKISTLVPCYAIAEGFAGVMKASPGAGFVFGVQLEHRLDSIGHQSSV